MKKKKNKVFPKGFLVTFCKKSRFRKAKPAQSNEQHLFANAKSAIGRTFRKKRNTQTNNDSIFFETSADWQASLPVTTTFAKVVQNPLSDISYRPS